MNLKNIFLIVIISTLFSFIFIQNLSADEIKKSNDEIIKKKYDDNAVSTDIRKAISAKNYSEVEKIFEKLISAGYFPRPDIALLSAFAFRKLNKKEESKKILLTLWKNIKDKKNPDVEFLIKDFFPSVMFTYKMTNESDEARTFFADAADFFKEHKDYKDIKKFIFTFYYSQFEFKGDELSGVKFQSLTGKEIDIKNYKGKYVLVDFWATWCPPCVQEIPALVKIYEKFAPTKLFDIIGISLDSDKDRLLKFIEKNQIKWEQYFDGNGWQNKIAAENGIQSIPAVFLLDREGKIIYMGLRGEILLAALVDLLE